MYTIPLKNKQINKRNKYTCCDNVATKKAKTTKAKKSQIQPYAHCLMTFSLMQRMEILKHCGNCYTAIVNQDTNNIQQLSFYKDKPFITPQASDNGERAVSSMSRTRYINYKESTISSMMR